MNKFGLVLCASLALGTQHAFAEDRGITLVARDRSATVQGNLIWQDSGKVCIETVLGEFIYLKRDMICMGNACQTVQDKPSPLNG